MVEPATGLGRSGFQDWLIQRVSAMLLALYMVFLCGYFFLKTSHSFAAWQNLFHSHWMKITTLLALIALISHAWIGMWTITTDYLRPVCIRLPVQMMIILALLVYLFWGINIVYR